MYSIGPAIFVQKQVDLNQMKCGGRRADLLVAFAVRRFLFSSRENLMSGFPLGPMSLNAFEY